MNKYTFMGNGKNKDFYFTFSFFSKGDIVVKINGTIATGYGVFCIPGTGNNDFPFTGGHIHFAKAPKSTDIVTIERELQLNRIIDYQPTAELTPTIVNQDMNYFFELLKDIKSSLIGFEETYAEFTDTESAQTLATKIDAAMEEIDTMTQQIEDLGNISTIRTSLSNLAESLNTLSSTVSDHTTTIGSHTTSIGTLDTFKEGVLDYVIATQTPTAENNYTWYRKYKSGWVEQGGHYTHNNTEATVTTNLVVTMADTNYNLQITKELSSASGTNCAYEFTPAWVMNSKTTTSFKTRMTSSNRLNGYDWYVSGTAAA